MILKLKPLLAILVVLPFLCLGSASAATCVEPTNVALAANGATATASSAYSGFAASGAINGDRKGLFGWQNGYWSTAAAGFPAWLEVQFNGSKTLTEIDVITIQNNYNAPVEPTEGMTFSSYGLTGYQVQYWTGSAWATISGGTVTGNNKVWRKFTFTAITTTKIRVLASGSPDNYGRLAEVEAWTGPSAAPRYNLALGAAASVSSHFAGWGASSTVNGDRKSLNAGTDGAWVDAGPAHTFPDWLQVDFGTNKTIEEIDVFTLQDNWTSPAEPTESMTFTQWGLRGYEVQYWNGSGWVTVPGGSVTGNNKIWRRFVFPPITTSRIRVLTNASVDGYSRITELEAYAPPASACASMARLDPLNATGGGGENPLSQNFNWNLPLVSLPGRAGMDLGLTLSYNSLVWTRNESYISFDDDYGFPSPGFRLGFPVIQPLHYNAETGKHGFLLISPDGSRTELRQVSTAQPNNLLYEAADSSHLLLDAGNMTLRAADGTRLTYELIGNQFHCTQIKDRNGNYLSINYVAGRLDKVIDTLGRQLKFNYDGNGLLVSITQTWNVGQASQVEHQWARFAYTDTTVQTNFPNLSVYGPVNNTTIKTLARVTLADDSRYEFSYTSWAQVWKVSHLAADNSLLNYRAYNLPGSPLSAGSPQADCPRFTQRRDWARYWNGDVEGTPVSIEEAVTTYSGPVSDTWTMPGASQPVSGKRTEVTSPDGTVNKTYFVDMPGTPRWSRGLPALVETSGNGVWQRKVVTTWTQDNVSVGYLLNPRVLETNIYDPAGNRARTQISYQQFTYSNETSCWLPRDVFEYAADAETVLRTTRTFYNTSTSYSDRRILGLPSRKQLYEGNPNLSALTHISEADFFYDESGSIQGHDAPVQHDNTAYAANFVTGRGNLTSVRRYNVINSQFTTTSSSYNTAGAVVSTKDASNHETLISYADVFSDNNNSRNTLAYPTTLTDPDGYSATAKYSFDFGAITSRRTPLPNVTTNTPGPEQAFSFDSLGRLQQLTNLVNNAYTRFVYATDNLRVDTYTTIQEGLGEAHSFQIADGAGRTIATATDHPGSAGGFSGQRTIYDVMGRVFRTSNPTETNAEGTPFQWTATGDDVSTGWLYTQQTYDWKGRPVVTTNPDGTTKTISYAGCGCAGGQVMTLTDEGTLDNGIAKRRQQRIYSDVLGRTVKNEFLNWEGGSVYSATVYTYNGRDQVTLTRQYAGPEGSSTYQDTTRTYDGYGRLSSQHVPEQNHATATVWTYNADDTIQSITDARNASTSYTYNARHHTTGITYSASGDISVPAPVSYGYDAAGNRLWMDENGQRRVTYHYNTLSMMDWEERQFPSLAGQYRLSYEYNLAGQLKSIKDHTDIAVNYEYDRAGRIATVGGTPYGTGGNNGVPYREISVYASNFKYRAWGDLKSLTYGNQMTLAHEFDQRLRMTQFVVGNMTPMAPMFDTRFMSSNFQYYADGTLRAVLDNLGDVFDRAYSYDHVRGPKDAYSGSEAIAFLNGTTSGTATGPYRQTYQHDPFGNITNQTNRYWSQSSSTNATYSNNRKQGTNVIYDADGNITLDADLHYEYDAAGRSSVIWTHATGKWIAPIYDGDGQVVHRSEFDWATQIPNLFQLRSTVLGGKVITELDSQGQKKTGYVYCNGRLIALQLPNWIVWQHENPFTRAHGASTRDGLAVIDVEPDPMRVDLGLYDPYIEPEFWGPPVDGLVGLFPGEGMPSGRCVLDGIAINCQDAMHLMHIGAAEFEQPTAVWDDGRWSFVKFNRDRREYETEWRYTGFEVKTLTVDGETSGTSRDLYTRVTVASETEALFRMFGFYQSGSKKGTGKTQPHVLNTELLKSALADCIHELYPMFTMTSYVATSRPPSEANNDAYNGVVWIKGQNGSSFPVVSDPTPPQSVKNLMKSRNARGATSGFGNPSGDNPFWTYSCPGCDRSNGDEYGRPSEERYPELYRVMSMDARVQIHELGAALTLIRNAYYPFPPAPLLSYPELKDNGLYRGGHGDDGPAMEDCVGRKYFNRAGLKPRN